MEDLFDILTKTGLLIIYVIPKHVTILNNSNFDIYDTQ